MRGVLYVYMFRFQKTGHEQEEAYTKKEEDTTAGQDAPLELDTAVELDAPVRPWRLWSITNYPSKDIEGKNTHSQKLDYSSSSTVEIYKSFQILDIRRN